MREDYATSTRSSLVGIPRHVHTFCFSTNRNTAPWQPKRIGLSSCQDLANTGCPSDLVSAFLEAWGLWFATYVPNELLRRFRKAFGREHDQATSSAPFLVPKDMLAWFVWLRRRTHLKSNLVYEDARKKIYTYILCFPDELYSILS